MVKSLLLDILLPRYCLGCGKEGKYICDECSLLISENSLICTGCFKDSFTGETHPGCSSELDGLVAGWDYDGLIKVIVKEIREYDAKQAIGFLTKSLFQTITANSYRFRTFLSFLFSENTRIAYIPMDIKEEKRRGFNYSKVMAEEVGKICNKGIVPISEGIEYTWNIVIVDDLFISGETLNRHARILKQSGVEQIWALVFSRSKYA